MAVTRSSSSLWLFIALCLATCSLINAFLAGTIDSPIRLTRQVRVSHHHPDRTFRSTNLALAAGKSLVDQFLDNQAPDEDAAAVPDDYRCGFVSIIGAPNIVRRMT